MTDQQQPIESTQRMKVGFVGLGSMGHALAASLKSAGHQLTVFDLNKELMSGFESHGVKTADSPAGVAWDADAVFTCLPGPIEVEKVALCEVGLLGAMRSHAAWFDLTTNSPVNVRRLHKLFRSRGIELLDAPISGGPHGAKTRRLALWVGGEKAAFTKHEELLRSMADRPLYMGEIGTGSIAKLVHNSASFTAQSALAEAFTLGVKAGVEPLRLFAALREGTAGRSRMFDRLAEHFLPGIYEPPAFALRLAHKDISLDLDLARSHDYQMRQAEIVQRDVEESMARGWAGRDARISLSLHEERAGVSINIPREQIDRLLAD